MNFNIANALRGMGGEFEINRVVGAIGGVAYILFANAFVALNMVKGREFTLAEEQNAGGTRVAIIDDVLAKPGRQSCICLGDRRRAPEEHVLADVRKRVVCTGGERRGQL